MAEQVGGADARSLHAQARARARAHSRARARVQTRAPMRPRVPARLPSYSPSLPSGRRNRPATRGDRRRAFAEQPAPVGASWRRSRRALPRALPGSVLGANVALAVGPRTARARCEPLATPRTSPAWCAAVARCARQRRPPGGASQRRRAGRASWKLSGWTRRRSSLPSDWFAGQLGGCDPIAKRGCRSGSGSRMGRP